MILGITGPAGAGKDTLADILVEHYGFKKSAFAKKMYQEISDAFSLPIEFLQNRKTKEIEQECFALKHCLNQDYVQRVLDLGLVKDINEPRSFRRTAQIWGTEYRRSQSDHYWLNALDDEISSHPDQKRWVVTDTRFDNEGDFINKKNGTLLRLTSPGITFVADHISEYFWQNCTPNIDIINDHSLGIEHFQAIVHGLAKTMVQARKSAANSGMSFD